MQPFVMDKCHVVEDSLSIGRGVVMLERQLKAFFMIWLFLDSFKIVLMLMQEIYPTSGTKHFVLETGRLKIGMTKNNGVD